MTKEKLAIKLAIDIMERNVGKYINHGIYEVSDIDGAVHVEFAEAINILNGMLEQQPCPYWDYGLNTCRHANIGALATKPCEDAISSESMKIDEWDIKGKPAELWIVNGKLQIRYQGTIHNTDLPSVTPIRPKGEWIEIVDEETAYSKTWHYECSECGKNKTNDQVKLVRQE